MTTKALGLAALAGLALSVAANAQSPNRTNLDRTSLDRATETTQQASRLGDTPNTTTHHTLTPARPSPADTTNTNALGTPPAYILTVLHHSDGESQLLGAPGNDDFGNVARFKTLMDNLRADALADPLNDGIPRGVVVLTSGDNYLPGPEFNASLANGVPYFDSIAYDAIGYDAIVLGNHDFDFGPQTLRDFIDGFTAPPAFLSSNLDFSTEPALAPLAGTTLLPSVVVNTGGQQVGIIGATTPDIRFIASPGQTTINPVLPAVQAEVTKLTGMGVDKIILSSHLQDLAAGEFALIPQLDDVDAVVAGGSGTLFANAGDLLVPGDTASADYPTNINDNDGTPVPVVGTADDYKYIGRLVLEFDANGELLAVAPTSGPVRVSGIAPDAVAEDPTLVNDVLNPVAAFVAALDAHVVATTSVDLDGRRSSVRSFETNLGNLVAESQLWTARQLADDFNVNPADVAIANGGGIRIDAIIDDGDVTVLDTFDTLPFSNFVTVVEDVTPENFKELLENAVSTQGGLGSTGRFFQIAGFSVIWDVNQTPMIIDDDTGDITQQGERIRQVILDDGTPVVIGGVVLPVRSINIATVNFLAGGGDEFPFPAEFTILGTTYQQALENYLRDALRGNISAATAAEGGNGRIRAIPAAP